MRIAIVTDAWHPQVNGVVRTLETTRQHLERRGHVVGIVSPDGMRSIPCPSYPEIRLALTSRRDVGRRLDAFAPEALHIATEGPLGHGARGWACRRGVPFTTAFHTRFPDYVAQRTGIPASAIWRFIRRFHEPAAATLAATPSLDAELASRGIGPVKRWSRGVDLANFSPDGPRLPEIAQLPGPVLLYVGRIAVEKNLEAFLRLDHPGTKVVVGDGPARRALATKYPLAVFAGVLKGVSLAAAYRSADVFVFPSLTDTFGLVMIEALACGTPVAAFDTAGPRDILMRPVGAMSSDLGAAVAAALTRDRSACARYARTFDWETATSQFENALVPFAQPGGGVMLSAA